MVLIIDSWKGSENLINNGVLISNRGGGGGGGSGGSWKNRNYLQSEEHTT